MTAYSVVIATYERPRELRVTLDGLAAQTHVPAQVIVVDASPQGDTGEVARDFASRLPLRYERAEAASSARQRNQGGRGVTTPLISFVDDDVRLPPDIFAKLCAALDTDSRLGGVAARIAGLEHPIPRGLLRAYYRLQAGFAHPTYGGKLFGPAINCLPSYTEADGELIPADWLNSTCVCYRTTLFQAEMFPAFDGYSFMEDVHLSARIARAHPLGFHKTAIYEHLDATSTFKRDRRQLARMRLRNQRRIAQEIMGLGPVELATKLFLHRIFTTACLLRSRGIGWREDLLGTWT